MMAMDISMGAFWPILFFFKKINFILFLEENKFLKKINFILFSLRKVTSNKAFHTISLHHSNVEKA